MVVGKVWKKHAKPDWTGQRVSAVCPLIISTVAGLNSRCSGGCQAELPPASVTVLSRVSSVDLSLPHSRQTVLHYDGIR